MKAGLQVGDIVTAVANNEIDQNGNYVDPLYGKIEFTNLLTAHVYAGDVVPFRIQRNGKPMQLTVTLEHRDAKDYVSPPVQSRSTATILCSRWPHFSGAFTSISQRMGSELAREAPQRLVYLDHFQSELFPDRNQRVVLSSQVLPANSTIGYDEAPPI